jgi:DNA-binding XRE family transcriptional regulator
MSDGTHEWVAAMETKRRATKLWRPSMDRLLNEDPELRAMVQEELEGMQIAQDLVRIRERHGLTQKDIAERIGVSQPLIARLEAGKAANVQLKTLIRYAAAAGSSVRLSFVAWKRRGTSKPPAAM